MNSFEFDHGSSGSERTTDDEDESMDANEVHNATCVSIYNSFQFSNWPQTQFQMGCYLKLRL